MTTTQPAGPTLDTLDHAIGALGTALNSSLWADGNHLGPSLGNQAADNIAQAVQQLAGLANPPAPPPPGPPPAAPTYPAWVTTGLLDLSQSLRIVDANTISDNLTSPTAANALANAQTQFGMGETALGGALFPQAANSYDQAWKQAVQAHGSGQSSHNPINVLVSEDDTGRVASITTATGRTVSYLYTGANLTSFTDADQNTWTYNYGSSGLTGVTDPLMHPRLAVTYYGNGKVETAEGEGSQRHFEDSYDWSTPGTAIRTATIQLSGASTATTTATYVDQYSGNDLVSQEQPNGATTDYSYDGGLDLTASQGPLGDLTQMTYSPGGDLLSETTPWTSTTTATTHMTYNAAHFPTSATDADGNTTTWAYAGNNMVKSTPPGPAAGATTFSYNLLGEELETDRPTAIQTFTYDGAGNQTGFQITDLTHHALDGFGPVFAYNEDGEKTSSTDPRGHPASGSLDTTYQTTMTYDPAGNLLSTTSPGPQTTSTAYTDAGDVASVTDPNGQTTDYSWNEAALTYTATNMMTNKSTTSLFDPSGNLLAKTSAGGATTSYTYDRSGDQISVTTPDGITTSSVYNLEGKVTSTSDTAGNTSTIAYDPSGRPIRETSHGNVKLVSYDAAGNIVSTTDADGRTTTWSYNSHGSPASVTTGTGGVTRFNYDLSDNLTQVTEGNGNVIGYSVNGLGQRTGMTVNNALWQYGYDTAGNQTSAQDPDGRLTSYTVNAQDLRTEIKYQQSGLPTIDVTQAFNAAGQRTSMTDGGQTTQYGYDANGNLNEVDEPNGTTYTYNYDTPGEMIEKYPDGTLVTYGYDDSNNVMSVSTSTGVSASYIRNIGRQVTGIAYGNGILETEGYDASGDQTSNSLLCGGAPELTSFTGYDNSGDPTGNATTVGSMTTTQLYGYDATDRVSGQSTTSTTAAAVGKAATNPDPGCTDGSAMASAPAGNDTSGTTNGAPSPGDAPGVLTGPGGTAPTGTPSTPITYDAVGNQTSGGNITYNAADEISGDTSANPVNYTYDKSGNILTKTAGGNTTTYSYNAADQLSEVLQNDGTKIDYTYDGDGNRISKTVTDPSNHQTVTDYSWDPSGVVPLLTLITNGSNGDSLIDRFIYGVGPVAMQTPGQSAGSTDTYYLHTNQIGSVTAMSDSSGDILETFTYDAFGNVTSAAIAMGATIPDEPLLFQGQFRDGQAASTGRPGSTTCARGTTTRRLAGSRSVTRSGPRSACRRTRPTYSPPTCRRPPATRAASTVLPRTSPRPRTATRPRPRTSPQTRGSP